MNYDKWLLDELRLVTYEKPDSELSDELLAKAVTVNENLLTLGYVLSPADLAVLAVSPSLNGFYDKLLSLTDQVKASPMYPGFPEQVMEMEDAVFRFHQMFHYFSTYGMEALLGVQVKRGWLPCNPTDGNTPLTQEANPANKTSGQKSFLSNRTSGKKSIPGNKPSGKKTILTAKALSLLPWEERQAAFSLMKSLCQHTGDVLRCADYFLFKLHSLSQIPHLQQFCYFLPVICNHSSFFFL